jgi:hypothetical protein
MFSNDCIQVVELPFTHPHLFESLNIAPPKVRALLLLLYLFFKSIHSPSLPSPTLPSPIPSTLLIPLSPYLPLSSLSFIFICHQCACTCTYTCTMNCSKLGSGRHRDLHDTMCHTSTEFHPSLPLSIPILPFLTLPCLTPPNPT